MNGLEDLEDMMKGPGETPVVDDAAEETTALQSVLNDKPHELQLRVMHVVSKRNLDMNDPALDLFNAAGISADAAAAVEAAAREVASGVRGIPEVIQKAVLAGGQDIKGEVRQAFILNIEDLKKGIHAGISGGSGAAISLIDNSTKKLVAATQNFDSEMNQAIIAKRDAVLSQWVNSGSDALDKRIREAIKTERTVNLVFILFAIAAALVIGLVLGMHLHF